MNQYKGVIFAVISTILWAGNFIIARGLANIVDPFSLSFFRWTIALIFLLPIAYRDFKNDINLIKENSKYLIITSILGITLFNTLIYIGARTTYAINLSVIVASSPVFTIIFSKFILKETFNLKKIIGFIISIIGVLVIITKGNLFNLLELKFKSGDLITLSSALVFALYNVLVKKKPENLNNKSFLLSTFLYGWVFLLIIFIVFNDFNLALLNNIRILFSLLYVGIFASLISFFTWNYAIEIIGPSSSVLIYYLTPVFSSIFAVIILKERFYIYHLISLFLIITAILITNFKLREIKHHLISNKSKCK
jgi:drug/metabolite transporter (DMT)-like permease